MFTSRRSETGGYVVQTDGKYDIGLRFLETGSIVRRWNSLYRAAREEVDRLATEVEEEIVSAIQNRANVVELRYNHY